MHYNDKIISEYFTALENYTKYICLYILTTYNYNGVECRENAFRNFLSCNNIYCFSCRLAIRCKNGIDYICRYREMDILISKYSENVREI